MSITAGSFSSSVNVFPTIEVGIGVWNDTEKVRLEFGCKGEHLITNVISFVIQE